MPRVIPFVPTLTIELDPRELFDDPIDERRGSARERSAPVDRRRRGEQAGEHDQPGVVHVLRALETHDDRARTLEPDLTREDHVAALADPRVGEQLGDDLDAREQPSATGREGPVRIDGVVRALLESLARQRGLR